MPSTTSSSSAFEPHQAFPACTAMHDELADQQIVIGRDRVAVIDSQIDAYAESAGRMVVHDLAG